MKARVYMTFRFASMCCLLYIWINIAIPSANGQTDVPLSVSFSGQDTHYVATLDNAAGEWRVIDLGDAVLQGRMDIHRINPVWSPDGHFLFYNRITDTREDNFAIASEIMRYDAIEADSQFINEPFAPEDVRSIVEAIQFGAFSPDGRYLWAYRVVAQQHSYLIDLQTNTVIFSADGWYETLSWEQGLFRTTLSTSLFPDTALPPQVIQINLATGAIINEHTYPTDSAWLWRTAYQLSNTQLLVEADDGTLRLVDWQAETNTLLTAGTQLTAHTNANSIPTFAYQHDNHVFVLEPTSLTSTQVSTDDATVLRWGFTDAGLVLTEQIENDNGIMQVDWVQVEDDTRAITRLYEGDSMQVQQVSLTVPTVILREYLQDDANSVRWQIHTEAGVLYDAIFIREQNAMVRIHYDQFVSIDIFSLDEPEHIVTQSLIDLATGAIYTPPQADMRLITIAPNMSWVLYGQAVPDLYNTGFVAGVFAYQPESDTLVNIISDNERFIIFDDHHENFIWSQ